jgi:hypothetical protein
MWTIRCADRLRFPRVAAQHGEMLAFDHNSTGPTARGRSTPRGRKAPRFAPKQAHLRPARNPAHLSPATNTGCPAPPLQPGSFSPSSLNFAGQPRRGHLYLAKKGTSLSGVDTASPGADRKLCRWCPAPRYGMHTSRSLCGRQKQVGTRRRGARGGSSSPRAPRLRVTFPFSVTPAKAGVHRSASVACDHQRAISPSAGACRTVATSSRSPCQRHRGSRPSPGRRGGRHDRPCYPGSTCVHAVAAVRERGSSVGSGRRGPDGR